MECRDITLTEHDIDELKRAAGRTQGPTGWLETVLESVSDGLIATGADGHIRLINSAAQTLTGWKMREAVGRPLKEVFRIVDESTRGPLECPGVTVLREGRVVELANHAVLLARDGTERPITDACDEFGTRMDRSWARSLLPRCLTPSPGRAGRMRAWRRSSSRRTTPSSARTSMVTSYPGTTAHIGFTATPRKR